MSYQIEIIPALELLGAALNYAFRAEEAEDRIETSSSVIEWRKKVEKEISPFLSSDIEELFRFFAPPSFLRAAVVLFELNTPEELCDWLVPENAGPARELLLKLSEIEDGDPSKVSEAEVQSGLETYDSMFHSSLKDEVAVMLYALHNTEVFLRRLKLVLSEFYDSFVKEKLSDALEFLKQKRDDHQKMLDENGLKFLDQITLDNFSSLYSPGRPFLPYYCNDVLPYGKAVIQPAGPVPECRKKQDPLYSKPRRPGRDAAAPQGRLSVILSNYFVSKELVMLPLGVTKLKPIDEVNYGVDKLNGWVILLTYGT